MIVLTIFSDDSSQSLDSVRKIIIFNILKCRLESLLQEFQNENIGIKISIDWIDEPMALFHMQRSILLRSKNNRCTIVLEMEYLIVEAIRNYSSSTKNYLGEIERYRFASNDFRAAKYVLAEIFVIYA